MHQFETEIQKLNSKIFGCRFPGMAIVARLRRCMELRYAIGFSGRVFPHHKLAPNINGAAAETTGAVRKMRIPSLPLNFMPEGGHLLVRKI